MFGSSIYELLFILALVLVAIDFFIPNDISSLIAHVLLSYLIVHAVDLPLMYGILVGIGVWFVMVAFHYFIFKRFISKFCNKVVAPTVIPENPLERYVGKMAPVVVVDGRKLLRIEGDLIGFQNSETYSDGDLLRITSFENGILQTEKIHNY